MAIIFIKCVDKDVRAQRAAGREWEPSAASPHGGGAGDTTFEQLPTPAYAG